MEEWGYTSIPLIYIHAYTLVGRGPASAKNGRLGDTARVGFVPVVLDP